MPSFFSSEHGDGGSEHGDGGSEHGDGDSHSASGKDQHSLSEESHNSSGSATENHHSTTSEESDAEKGETPGKKTVLNVANTFSDDSNGADDDDDDDDSKDVTKSRTAAIRDIIRVRRPDDICFYVSLCLGFDIKLILLQLIFRFVYSFNGTWWLQGYVLCLATRGLRVQI